MTHTFKVFQGWVLTLVEDAQSFVGEKLARSLPWMQSRRELRGWDVQVGSKQGHSQEPHLDPPLPHPVEKWGALYTSANQNWYEVRNHAVTTLPLIRSMPKRLTIKCDCFCLIWQSHICSLFYFQGENIFQYVIYFSPPTPLHMSSSWYPLKKFYWLLSSFWGKK